MKSVLIDKMSQDLNIPRFEDETQDDHNSRLIYSALAAWSRTLTLGRSFTDCANNNILQSALHTSSNAVDDMHVKSRLTQTAYAMLELLPHNEIWGGGSNNTEFSGNLASRVIDNLIFDYEIIKLIDGKFALPPERIVAFGNVTLKLGGKYANSEKLHCVGLGRWKKEKSAEAPDYKKAFNIPLLTPKEYYDALIKDANWQYWNASGEYELYVPGIHYKINKSFIAFKRSKLPHGISLLRNQEKHRFLVLYKGGELLKARIDEWYSPKNSGEIYRIIHSINTMREKPSSFHIAYAKDHVVLRLSSPIPNANLRLLHLTSWPLKYDTYYNCIVPLWLWQEVSNSLMALGMKPMEGTNGIRH